MFNSINFILFDSKKNYNLELLEEFSPYMTCRYFSFSGDNFVSYANDYVNTAHNLPLDDEEMFKFYYNIIPKQKRKKIGFIKKPKVENSDVKQIPEFLSKRELDLMESTFKYIHGTTTSID